MKVSDESIVSKDCPVDAHHLPLSGIFPIAGASQNCRGNYPVEANPTSVAYDSGIGEVFVVNYGAGTVSVISDSDRPVHDCTRCSLHLLDYIGFD